LMKWYNLSYIGTVSRVYNYDNHEDAPKPLLQLIPDSLQVGRTFVGEFSQQLHKGVPPVITH
jgi:hypothetical protein